MNKLLVNILNEGVNKGTYQRYIPTIGKVEPEAIADIVLIERRRIVEILKVLPKSAVKYRAMAFIEKLHTEKDINSFSIEKYNTLLQEEIDFNNFCQDCFDLLDEEKALSDVSKAEGTLP